MGGFENYAADDLYNMEDVWNEKPFKKVRYLLLGFRWFVYVSAVNTEWIS